MEEHDGPTGNGDHAKEPPAPVRALEVALQLAAVLDPLPQSQSPVAIPLAEVRNHWKHLRVLWPSDWEKVRSLGGIGRSYEREFRKLCTDVADAARELTDGLSLLEASGRDSSRKTPAARRDLNVQTSQSWSDAIRKLRSLWCRLARLFDHLAEGDAASPVSDLISVAEDADAAARSFCTGLALAPEFWPLYLLRRQEEHAKGRDAMAAYLASALERRWRPFPQRRPAIRAEADEARTEFPEAKRKLLIQMFFLQPDTAEAQPPELMPQEAYLDWLARQVSRKVESELKEISRDQDERDEWTDSREGRAERRGLEEEPEAAPELKDEDPDLRELLDESVWDKLRRQHEELCPRLNEEEQRLLEVLEGTGGNRSAAARQLDEHRSWVERRWRRIKEKAARM